MGPLMADCFVFKLENDILDETIQSFHFYNRSIDDHFVICYLKIQMKEIPDIFQ